MEFIRIGDEVIRISSIAGFNLSESDSEAPRVVLYLATPFEGRTSITASGAAAERVLEWINNRLDYLDLRPGYGSKGVYLG